MAANVGVSALGPARTPGNAAVVVGLADERADRCTCAPVRRRGYLHEVPRGASSALTVRVQSTTGALLTLLLIADGSGCHKRAQAGKVRGPRDCAQVR